VSTIFDEEFEAKPKLLHWISKARKQLLRENKFKSTSFEYNLNIFERFMGYVRQKLWVKPSYYQQIVMSNIIFNSPKRNREDF